MAKSLAFSECTQKGDEGRAGEGRGWEGEGRGEKFGNEEGAENCAMGAEHTEWVCI